ncbi:MAG: DUF1700 domain-containing protein [Lachnospiraceae bacterium]|nr:DUF1700 domain-containing protein [Lachnospiraceae bacterium]
MNRADFMKELTELLADVSPTEREEAIQYYNDYFDDAGEENEQSVIASLGSPTQLARTIKTGLADGGNVGEFTEKGFSGYESKSSDEVMDLNNPADAGSESGSAKGTDSGWNSGSGWQQSGSSNWEQNAGSNQQFSGDNNYNGNQNTGNNYGNTSQSSEKKRMSGGMIALIVVLCIFASPFILGIGGGMLGAVVGLFGALFGIIVGIGAAAISLIIVGVCLFVYGIVLLFSMPLGGLAMMGVGMVCAAIGLLFLWLTVIICGMLVPAIIRGIVKLFNNIFHRGGEMA